MFYTEPMSSEDPFSINKAALEYTIESVERNINAEMPVSYAELEEMCSEDPITHKAFTEMVRYAHEYISDVWNMREIVKNRSQYTEDEWKELFAQADDKRTRLHDTFIDSIAILVRRMGTVELDNEWVRELMPSGKLERSACGKFGIMLVYSKYVNTLNTSEGD